MSRIDKDPDVQYTMLEYSVTDDDGALKYSVSLDLGDDGDLLINLNGPDQDMIDYKSVLDSFVSSLNDAMPFKFLNDIGHNGMDEFLRKRKSGLQKQLTKQAHENIR